jgi:single-strand selective monofunctional uracil DNA glycosylase
MRKAELPRISATSKRLIAAARRLSAQVDRLKFQPPVTHVYNPLTYAWKAHAAYLRRFGNGRKRVVFLGMNPGPFGMVQTGMPFGEIAAVRDWLGIRTRIEKPRSEHPKRPVLGFDCPRSEVSGRRLWKLFAERFGSPDQFFAGHFVANYCPLAFCEAGGRNQTPDKLSRAERDRLFAVCDSHLRRVLEILQPEWLVGIGGFAAERGRLVCEDTKIRVGQILHPSPASPKANRHDWTKTAARELVQLGVWD